ncbi:MAG: diguanylate cyclase [Thiohalocapsa sp.]
MTETDAQKALVESAAKLTQIPLDATDAYTAALPVLVQAVNAQIGNHARHRDWLGGNSPQILSDNHRHHGLFMEEVFSTGEFQLLALSLPWVYHAYHARGVPYDYFQAELGYWKQAVAEAMPGEQATSIIAVYDWMLAQHDRVIGSAELRGEPSDGVDPALAELFDALLTALRAFDDDRILQVVRGARDGGLALPELLQGLIYPLMKRVGRVCMPVRAQPLKGTDMIDSDSALFQRALNDFALDSGYLIVVLIDRAGKVLDYNKGFEYTVRPAGDPRNRPLTTFLSNPSDDQSSILPDTNAAQALQAGERIRAQLAELRPLGQEHRFTVSLGLAMRQANDDTDRLLAHADQALYEAKDGGRNRVAIYKPGQVPASTDAGGPDSEQPTLSQ